MRWRSLRSAGCRTAALRRTTTARGRGGGRGRPREEFFERIDDRSRRGHAELRKIGEKVCAPGDLVGMPRGVIHRVSNETDAVTLSLHIYGKHINYTDRSQFDVEARTETPFMLDVRK